MQNEPKNVYQWLRDNAVLVSTISPTEGYLNDQCWVLADHLHEKFVDALLKFQPHDEINQGCTKTHFFLTTNCGLVILDPTGIRKEQVVTYNGIKFMRPELDRLRWFAPTSKYITQIKMTTDSIAEAELTRVEKVRAEEERSKRFMANIQRVEAEQRAINSDPAFQALITKLVNFDHTFEESDDHRYAMATRARLREIEAELNKFDVDGPAIAKRIISSHYMS
jgi:hypothetical protein